MQPNAIEAALATTSPLTAEMLAASFKAVLQQWLQPGVLRMIDTYNLAEKDPSICHSHDVCDPNQAMINALQQHGLEFNAQDEEQHKLINAAWDLAKKHGFSNPAPL